MTGMPVTRRRPTYVGMLSAVFACLLVTALNALAADSYTATEARPMYEVVRALEQKYNWRVTYEDPPFENVGELTDMTHPLYRATHPNARDLVLVPRAVPFTFTWIEQGNESDRRSVIDQCVTQHNRMSRNPGEFRTYHQGSISHVYSAAVRSRDGSMRQTGSVLDTRITFPKQERTLAETISLILAAVASQSGFEIALGSAPQVMAQPISIGADQITARDALLLAFNASDARLLEMGGPVLRMSWAMLYQADEKRYYLNLHPTHVQPGSDLLLGKQQ